jgi:hypothetical protein
MTLIGRAPGAPSPKCHAVANSSQPFLPGAGVSYFCNERSFISSFCKRECERRRCLGETPAPFSFWRRLRPLHICAFCTPLTRPAAIRDSAYPLGFAQLVPAIVAP